MEESMALIEDVFKGNLATGLAVGVGAVILGPTVIQTMGRMLRPAAKAVIRGGMIFYRETLSEIGEMASDLVAEVTAELDGEAHAGRVRAAEEPKPTARPAIPKS
jgi:Protein of unknown function (DUF5132)